MDPSGVYSTTQWDGRWDWQKFSLCRVDSGAFGNRNLGHQLPCIAPFRCKAYGSVPLAHLQPRTYYNASWQAVATSPTPSPQSPAPSKLPQMRRLQQTQVEHQSTTTTTTLQTPAVAFRPGMVPRAQSGVPHPGYYNGRKLQGEFKTKLLGGRVSGCSCFCVQMQ